MHGAHIFVWDFSFQLTDAVIRLDKVQTLWEGHKIWKNLPPVLTKQLFLLCILKISGRFFQIFVALSKKLEFSSKQIRQITRTTEAIQ